MLPGMADRDYGPRPHLVEQGLETGVVDRQSRSLTAKLFLVLGLALLPAGSWCAQARPAVKAKPAHKKQKKRPPAKPVDLSTLPGLGPASTAQAEVPPEPAPQPVPQPPPQPTPPPKRPVQEPPKRPARPFVPFSGARYSFQTPVGWEGPELLPEGMRYVEPKGEAFISISFHEWGSPEYKDPPEFRRWMRQLGSIEDAHALDTVKVSGRFASRVRTTTYYYTPAKLLGQELRIFTAEMIMVPDPQGAYVIRYQAAKDAFQKHRAAYISFLATLILPRNATPPEDYYVQQDHIVQELLEERAPPPGGAEPGAEKDAEPK